MFIAPPTMTCSSHIPTASISTEPLRQVFALPIRNIGTDLVDAEPIDSTTIKPSENGEPPGQKPEQQRREGPRSRRKSLQLDRLPGEIQETILESLLGTLGSTSCSTNDGSYGTKNWSSIMRHPRRRQVADLALVSPTWRRLVQQRIYRHGMHS